MEYEDQFVDFPDCGVYDRDGRSWSAKPTNELNVGYLFASLTHDQIVTYLQWVYKELHDVTSEEVQRLWFCVIPNSANFYFWKLKSIDSDEVKETLAAMKVEWNMWRDLGEEGIMKELGEE